MEMTKKMIKFVCISDTHTKTSTLKLPKGDVLIHAGDFTFGGKKSEIEGFSKFLAKLDFQYKIIIAGNHELTFDEEYFNKNISRLALDPRNNYPTSSEEAKKLLGDCIYLENSGTELFGYKIWGSPTTPEFYNWAFMKQRGEEINKVWDTIPDDTDILITHGPPYGILDKNYDNQACGCEELTNQVTERIKPLYHIFGHIHEANGTKKYKETTFINASICNLRYKPDNNFYVFELEDKSS